jgi:hypothetical protein
MHDVTEAYNDVYHNAAMWYNHVIRKQILHGWIARLATAKMW